jgi:hypothetical protein
MKFLSCFLLTLSLGIGPAMAQGVPLEQSEKRAVVERAGELLATNYVFPDLGGQAKAEITSALMAGKYDGITDARAFAQRLTADLQSVTNDRHMRVFVTPANVPVAADSPPTPSLTYAGFERVDRLVGNIGYIKLDSFLDPGPFKAMASQAMADLANSDALIIDMRDNGGGRPELVAYLCSFFFNPRVPVHINDLIFRTAGTDQFITTQSWTNPVPQPFLGKPVYILTSKRTFSGGEEFVNDMKVQKRATVIGETTGGGANPGNREELDPRFEIFIPDGRPENPITRTSWEGRGVAPDVRVDEKQALQIAVQEILAQRAAKSGAADRGAPNNPLTPGTDADALVQAHLLTVRTTALSNSAFAVRRNIEELAQGRPNYDLMSDDLADATKANLAQLQAELSALGAIKTVTFKYVAPSGLDVYDVHMANGSIQSGIFVSPNGKIESAWIHPVSVAQRPAPLTCIILNTGRCWR